MQCNWLKMGYLNLSLSLSLLLDKISLRQLYFVSLKSSDLFYFYSTTHAIWMPNDMTGERRKVNTENKNGGQEQQSKDADPMSKLPIMLSIRFFLFCALLMLFGRASFLKHRRIIQFYGVVFDTPQDVRGSQDGFCCN